MPLVYADLTVEDVPVTAAQERARKVKKQYLDGPLVSVASARHQAEAEMIQALLLDEGVPSMLRRTRGFDVPDMLAAGPRDVLVPQSGAEVARELLLQAEIASPEGDGGIPVGEPRRVLAVLLLACIVVPLLIFLVLSVTQ